MKPGRLILTWFAIAVVASTATAQMGMGRARMPRYFGEPIAPASPVSDPVPDFPLRVHLFSARWGGVNSSYQGYGSGNLLDAKGLTGFDYTYDCEVPFVQNQGASDLYQARWKTEPYKLEILMVQAGHDRYDTCTLRLSPRPQAVDPAWKEHFANGPTLATNPRWDLPDMVFLEPDPDYPVQLHVLTAYRRAMPSGVSGYGTGNLLGPQPRGVDFRYNCAYGFYANFLTTDYFEGHWVKPEQRLEILMARPGSDRVDKCQLSVTVRDQPYSDQPMQTPQPATPNTPGRPSMVRPAAPGAANPVTP